MRMIPACSVNVCLEGIDERSIRCYGTLGDYLNNQLMYVYAL
jgi:hypothetical protein